MDSEKHSTPQSSDKKSQSSIYFDSKNISANRPTAGSNTTITHKNEKKPEKPPVNLKTAFANTFKSLGRSILRFFKFIGRNIARFFKFAFSGKHKLVTIPVLSAIVIVAIALPILFNTVWKSQDATPYLSPADNVDSYQLTGWLKENQDTYEQAFSILGEGKTDSFDNAVKVLDDAIAASADNQQKQYDLITKKAVFYNTEAEDPETAISILKAVDISGLDEDQKFLLASNLAVFYDALGEEGIAQRYRDKLYAIAGLSDDSAWYEILKEQGELPSDMNAELTGEEDKEEEINE
ncbi:hypothetical protein IJG66_00935 [Candidatus Saccharibacteria bacterium]|nr:hypothetical protein [Candidatus Saccharibacteria bacterium]